LVLFGWRTRILELSVFSRLESLDHLTIQAVDRYRGLRQVDEASFYLLAGRTDCHRLCLAIVSTFGGVRIDGTG